MKSTLTRTEWMRPVGEPCRVEMSVGTSGPTWPASAGAVPLENVRTAIQAATGTRGPSRQHWRPAPEEGVGDSERPERLEDCQADKGRHTAAASRLVLGSVLKPCRMPVRPWAAWGQHRIATDSTMIPDT